MSEYNTICRQTDRILIIDETVSSLVIRDIYKSLLQFLILSDNVDPLLRTPRLGISQLQITGRDISSSILLPFQPVNKSSISKLKTTMTQLNTNLHNYKSSSHLENRIRLEEGITESITSQLHAIIAAHHDASIGCEFNLIIMTGRDRIWIENNLKLHSSLAKFKNILVKKVEAVCLSSLENCLQDTRMSMDQLVQSQNQISLSPDNSISQVKMDSAYGVEGVMRTFSIMADDISLQQYFKNWLTVENSDSVDVTLRIGQMTLKCDIRDCMLRTDWLPFQSPFSVTALHHTNQTNISNMKHYNTQPIQIGASLELDSVCVLEENGICESVLFGIPRVLRPTSYWKLDWEDLEDNQERFHAIAQNLSERKQYILVKQSCSIDSKGRRLPIAHYLVLPCNQSNGRLLIKPVITRELLMENEFETAIRQIVSKSLMEESNNALDSLSHFKEYNPLNYESKLCACLEQMYETSRNNSNIPRSTVSVRNERGLVGSAPYRKGVSRGRKRMAFMDPKESDEMNKHSLQHRNRYPYVISDDNDP
ncbi:hypothetical protein LOD99_13245 [Oopsacas minuta]|uniref:Meiosis 1 arrest protein n=1 Tax=Oopsacas minuta TaxID=111878 RepID=A0AAV7JB88_9METZ|nr:hypothetical protein LOD99_13245 [Oopsacas minuta]